MEHQVLAWITQYGYVAIRSPAGVRGLSAAFRCPMKTLLTFLGFTGSMKGNFSLPLAFGAALLGSLTSWHFTHQLHSRATTSRTDADPQIRPVHPPSPRRTSEKAACLVCARCRPLERLHLRLFRPRLPPSDRSTPRGMQARSNSPQFAVCSPTWRRALGERVSFAWLFPRQTAGRRSQEHRGVHKGATRDRHRWYSGCGVPGVAGLLRARRSRT